MSNVTSLSNVMKNCYFKIQFYSAFWSTSTTVANNNNNNIKNVYIYILGSILGSVLPKTLKMVLDLTLLNTQQYQVRIKGKVEQSRERNSTLTYTSL